MAETLQDRLLYWADKSGCVMPATARETMDAEAVFAEDDAACDAFLADMPLEGKIGAPDHIQTHYCLGCGQTVRNAATHVCPGWRP